MTTVAEVRLWDRRIGATSIAEGDRTAAFEYDPDFAKSHIEVSPIKMPLSNEVFAFPDLAHETFHGLPGLLADSLPDRFGNAVINAWLARQGRSPASLNAVERLCHVGSRGMGALEFYPATGPEPKKAETLEVAALVELASQVLREREQLAGSFANDEKSSDTLLDILKVGTSAGGARAKAVIAWNPQTREVRSGQARHEAGFEDWIIKFDGVAGNRDKELEDPEGYGAIEYAYHLMASAAGIEMAQCRLLEEDGRRHFMTRRFDRTPSGQKLHMQSLGALGHYDYNAPGAHSYEEAFLTARSLGLGMDAIEELYRRMLFNVFARNQDDHVKNIAFLMDKRGRWSLSPAFDVTYSYNPSGAWTATHQMTIAGKRENFTWADLRTCARVASMKRGRAEAIGEEVIEAVTKWEDFSRAAGVTRDHEMRIAAALVLRLDPNGSQVDFGQH
ncbi:MAG: type II toxin-antitoxin system HipA family toxin [Myxococcota bacterium]|jgi:serine/threonine-protein kinase HipA|nr:type II toxin-antitoxin system HipA family toxin [Myxococcota bacterium]